MVLLITAAEVQKTLAYELRKRRIAIGLTQAGLARRAGVALPTLRKFEQKGLISLESFLKLSMVLDVLDKLVEAVSVDEESFNSIDEVIAADQKPRRQKGWRT